MDTLKSSNVGDKNYETHMDNVVMWTFVYTDQNDKTFFEWSEYLVYNPNKL